MQAEMADRLVELFQTTGLRQISFDGLEGCERTGHGLYAHSLFVGMCFAGWKDEVINDASRLTHYNWHIHTRMNWGEPWGKATRDGMPDYRFKNQDYFERNLLPPMMGWFQLRLASSKVDATNDSDMEWVLSKCAGYNSGFALATSLDAMKKNGKTGPIMDAIREWETARLSGVFSEDQRERLRDSSGEFHLEASGENRWELYPVAFSPVFSYEWEERQPGEPTYAQWDVENRFAPQPLQFTLRVVPGGGSDAEAAIIDPTFTLGIHQMKFPVRLIPSQYLVFDGNGDAAVYDVNWNLLQTVKADSTPLTLPHGRQSIRFEGGFGGDMKPRADVKFKTMGEPEIVE